MTDTDPHEQYKKVKKMIIESLASDHDSEPAQDSHDDFEEE